MKAEAQWEVTGDSGQSQGFAENTGAVMHCSLHSFRVHHLHLGTWACSCPLPLMCTDRQTDTQGQSQLHKLQSGHKAALGAGDSSWDRDVDPHWRLSHTLVVLAQISSQGALLPWEGHSEAKFWVPFLCPSSPWQSITVQLKSTWRSRALLHVLPFPLGQSSLFKRNYGSAMTGKAHGVWAIPSQWWFWSSFLQFWLYVPPFLLGQEFQVPVIHYWRTESEGQTNLSFSFLKKIKNLSPQQGNSALAFLPYSGLNNSNEIQPLPLIRKVTEKLKNPQTLSTLSYKKTIPIPSARHKAPSGSCQVPRWQWPP